MNKMSGIFLCLLLLILQGTAQATTSYHIGNSLTWDMQPLGVKYMAIGTGKEHQVGYHLIAGAHLDYIWNNPDDTRYMITYLSGDYVNSLSSYEWDYVTIQPYYKPGSTLAQDQMAIENFIDFTLAGPSQSPVFFVYSAWPASPDDYQLFWDQPIPNEPSQQTTHARDYFTHLYENLLGRYGEGFQLYMIPVGEVLYRLDREFKAGNFSGFNNVGELYRDGIHLDVDIGRFIAGTTVYATMFRENPVGIERPVNHYLNSDGTTALTDELRIRLQKIVWDVVSHHPYSGIDVTPDAFTFTSLSGRVENTLQVSNEVTIAGINVVTEVSIVGGEYAINGGDFTSSPGTVSNNDTIVVRHLSSGEPASSVSTTITIGGVDSVFTSVTAENVQDDDQDDQGNDENVSSGSLAWTWLLVLSVILLYFNRGSKKPE